MYEIEKVEFNKWVKVYPFYENIQKQQKSNKAYSNDLHALNSSVGTVVDAMIFSTKVLLT